MTREDENAVGALPVGDLPKLFISYKKNEKKQQSDNGLIYTRDLAARKLISLADCAVWHDEFLTPGGNYNWEIETAIKESDAVVLLLTSNVLESKYIWDVEMKLAKENGKMIIPIAFDFSKDGYGAVESRLSCMHIINWPGGDDDAAQTESEFNDALGRVLERLSSATGLTQEIGKIQPLIDAGVSLADISLRNWYLMGRAYLEGIYVEKDAAKGKALLDAVTNIGSTERDVVELRCLAANALFAYYYGLHCDKPEEYGFSECRDYAKLGVELGDAELTYRRGYMYRKGRGAGRDPEQAAELFERAAKLGSAKAMGALGVMVRNGDGTKKDPVRAFGLLSEAAERGIGEAMYNLACMYADGEGTEKNAALAEKWHIRAAELNGGYAMRKLGEKYEEEKDYASAYKWYHNSAKHGDGIAMRRLGDMNRKGLYVPKDSEKAYGWYYRSAAVGNFVAMRYLGIMFSSDPVIGVNPVKAEEYFARSVEIGGARAANSLGYMYLADEDVARDIGKAEYWYTISANKGNANALKALERIKAGKYAAPEQSDVMPSAQAADPVQNTEPEQKAIQPSAEKSTDSAHAENISVPRPVAADSKRTCVSAPTLSAKEAKELKKRLKAKQKEDKKAEKQAAKEAKKASKRK